MGSFLPPFRSLTPALRALLLANVALFAFCQVDERLGLDLFSALALRPAWVADRPWTLLTYAFLHADVVHLALNMVMLWSFGDAVSKTLGDRRFVLFYLAAALAAGVASLFFYNGSIVGASGALFGVLYVFGALFPNQPLAAASMPTRFDPNGARLRYCESIQRLSLARSILTAMTASRAFHMNVFGCGLMRRTACIVIVDAPDTLLRPTTFWNAARTTDSGRTPRWVQNVPSSLATSALTIQSSGSAS